jgi:hypothetical protein
MRSMVEGASDRSLRAKAKQSSLSQQILDCFVAIAPRNDDALRGAGQIRQSGLLARKPRRFAFLLQRQRQSAQIQADDQAVLLAGECQHGAVLVGENHGLRAPDGGGAGAALGVDAVNVGRAVDIADGAMEVRLRGAEGEAVTQPADRQRIALAVERQHTFAGRAAHDEACLEDADADRAVVGVRNRRRAQKRSDTERRDGEEAGS